MLIDINAHVGHWPFQQLQYNNCEGLLQRMDRFGVDVSVVSNLNGVFYKNVQSANEELIREISSNKKFADRFVAFAIINPLYAGWREDLAACHGKMGMKGVRIYPAYHDYGVTDPVCIELVKTARDLGMPVALTLRMVDNRQRSWMDIQTEWTLKDILPLIREVPDAKYLILNVANGAQLGREDATVLKNADVLMDTSGRALANPGELLKVYGNDKFAFGTHAPIHDYLTGLLRIESMRGSEADHNVKEMLRSGNAKRFLKL